MSRSDLLCPLKPFSESRIRVRENSVESQQALGGPNSDESGYFNSKSSRTERTFQQRRTLCAIRIAVPVGIESNLHGGNLILCGDDSSADRKKAGEQISESSSLHLTDGDVARIRLSSSFAPTVRCLRHGQSCFLSPSEFFEHDFSEPSW